MRGLWLIETGCSPGRLHDGFGIYILFTVLCKKKKSTNVLPGSPLFPLLFRIFDSRTS